jgi:cell division septum initiation protein DivIVA
VGATPDQLKADIERTRGELTADVDALADKVSPTSIARRRTEGMRQTAVGVKERVMGKTDDLASTARGGMSSAGTGASSAAETVGQAPTMVKQQTQGNPLAAGLIAFGAGMLAATLFPGTQKENQLGTTVKEQGSDLAQPVIAAAKEAADQVRSDVQPAAQEAVEQVKESAKGAASTTADTAKEHSGKVADSAKSGADAVRQEARS